MSEANISHPNEPAEVVNPQRNNWDEIFSIYRRAASGDYYARQELILRLAPSVETIIANNGNPFSEDERQEALLAVIETVDLRLGLSAEIEDDTRPFRNRLHSNLSTHVSRAVKRYRRHQDRAIPLPIYTDINPVSGEEILDTIVDQTIVKHELDLLPNRRREIIYDRYGFCGRDPQTLEEIGDKMNITRERVRQLADFALKRLNKEPNIQLFRD